jgi:hypothetical protein
LAYHGKQIPNFPFLEFQKIFFADDNCAFGVSELKEEGEDTWKREGHLTVQALGLLEMGGQERGRVG